MKRSTLMLLLAAVLMAVLGGVGGGNAAECRGGSPTNHAGSCESADNHVTCGEGTATPLGVVSVSGNGAELCNDASGSVPLHGRIGAEGPDCDCIYADGTAENDAIDPMLQGWVRIDQNGASCSVEGQQSYNSGAGGPCP